MGFDVNRPWEWAMTRLLADDKWWKCEFEELILSHELCEPNPENVEYDDHQHLSGCVATTENK